MNPFHLAFPVHDLDAARAFYGGLLGCPEGRSSATWVDFDLRGHQIVAHLVRHARPADVPRHDVDGELVPVRHFGLVLPWDEWERLAEDLAARGTPFAVRPHVRFRGRVGEQATLFVLDPSGNALEFKAFRDPAQIFARGTDGARGAVP